MDNGPKGASFCLLPSTEAFGNGKGTQGLESATQRVLRGLGSNNPLSLSAGRSPSEQSSQAEPLGHCPSFAATRLSQAPRPAVGRKGQKE